MDVVENAALDDDDDEDIIAGVREVARGLMV
jgi:hypothetical protein